MGRNLNPQFRGQALAFSGLALEGEREVVATPDVMTDSDCLVSSNLTVAGAVAITLPSSVGIGHVVIIRDGQGDAGSNTITISAPAGETVNGAASVTITQNYGAALIRKSSATEWSVLARGNTSATAGTVTASGVTFTQTYSTASATVAAVTSHAITDSTGGTASTSALAAQAVTVTGVDGTGSNAASKADVDAQLVILRNNIATLAAELALVKADLLAAKQNDNKIIDAMQAGGLAV